MLMIQWSESIILIRVSNTTSETCTHIHRIACLTTAVAQARGCCMAQSRSSSVAAFFVFDPSLRPLRSQTCSETLRRLRTRAEKGIRWTRSERLGALRNGPAVLPSAACELVRPAEVQRSSLTRRRMRPTQRLSTTVPRTL